MNEGARESWKARASLTAVGTFPERRLSVQPSLMQLTSLATMESLWSTDRQAHHAIYTVPLSSPRFQIELDLCLTGVGLPSGEHSSSSRTDLLSQPDGFVCLSSADFPDGFLARSFFTGTGMCSSLTIRNVLLHREPFLDRSEKTP